MNEQNVDIETVKARLREVFEKHCPPGHWLGVTHNEMKTLLAHLERMEGVEDSARKCRTWQKLLTQTYVHADKAAKWEAKLDALLDATPPVDAADTKEVEHG